MSKAVCIVGLSPTSRDLVFGEPLGVEMWSVNTGHECFDAEHLARFTRWFQVHPRPEFEMANEQRPEHLKWLKSCGIPIYMEERWEDIPTSVKFPRQEVIRIAGDYFTSSVAYMVGLAIYERFEEIKLYGVDMPSDSEYFHERPCLEFWLGVAVANGIKIVTPAGCSLMKGRHYAETVKITSSHVETKRKFYQQARDQKLADFNEVGGEVKALEEMLAAAPDFPGLAIKLEQKRRKFQVTGGEYNAYCGAVQAMTELYIDALRPEVKQLKNLRDSAADQILASINGAGAK